MTTLFFSKHFHYDIKRPTYQGNDVLIFSKGHAAPLMYALYSIAGALGEDELMTLRQFNSPLEGHPTPRFPHFGAATGSLGQGLSVGAGIALTQQQFHPTPRTYVLLGDSEMAEGQVWEALAWASFRNINNLIALLDMNRLGQRGETMLGWDSQHYKSRIESFGWECVIVDGHDKLEIEDALSKIPQNKPFMIIAKTVKGSGLDIQNKNGWHGKVVETTPMNVPFRTVEITMPPEVKKIDENENDHPQIAPPKSTREAYGYALAQIMKTRKDIVVLDAEVSNSTFACYPEQAFPHRFYEMYISEQNMVSVAVGMSLRGKHPFVSTFGAFLTRAHDQLRMAQYNKVSLSIVGSHAGVAIGADGSSQMALEDIAMVRSLRESVVLCPADVYGTYACVQLLADYEGIGYLRTLRAQCDTIYTRHDVFTIGGSHVHGTISDASAVIIAMGTTLHEALAAQKKSQIHFIVVDAYSVKPLDIRTIRSLVEHVGACIVVEDHYSAGGLGEAVTDALAGLSYKYKHCCVKNEPHSGPAEALLSYEGIDSRAIMQAVMEMQ